MLNTKVLADLRGALTRSYEQSIYPELARAPQARIRGASTHPRRRNQCWRSLKCRSSKGRRPSRNDSSAKRSPPREQSARCSVRKRGYAKRATERSKPSLQRRQQRTPSAWRPNKQPAMRPKKQSEKHCLRLSRRRPGMPVTRHGRQPRSNGGGATSRNFSHNRDRKGSVCPRWWHCRDER
jgi:hypothetical protein